MKYIFILAMFAFVGIPVCRSQNALQKDTSVIICPLSDSAKVKFRASTEIAENARKNKVIFQFDDHNPDPKERAKSLFYIVIDTTKEMNQFNIDFTTMKVLSTEELARNEKIGLNSFLTLSKHNFFMLTDISGKFKLYKVLQTVSMYFFDD